MGIPVKLQVFEGPLDLLLHLIDKNRIDIYDIPIVEITSQYMDYIKAMEKEDLNIMSEFLVMAATLLDIKCRMLPEVQDYVEPVNLDELLGDLTLSALHKVFRDVMKRRADKIDPVRSKFGKIEKEEVTLPDKLTYVAEYAKGHRRFLFRDLLEKQGSRIQIVVTFLAVLQLMKEGTIMIEQEHPFDEIMILSKA